MSDGTSPEQTPDGDTWFRHMRQGNFAAAWNVSDAILRDHAATPCWHLPRHFQWIWNGRPFDGKRVLIRCYHGLGDTIQFIRFAPYVKAIAREVILWAQPALLPLLRTARGIDQLLPLSDDGAPEVAFDTDVESMELAHVFRVTENTPPADVPYLHVAPASFDLEPDRLHIGIVWAAGDWDPQRNVPVEALAPLWSLDGVCLHVLQRGDAINAWPRDVGRFSGRERPEDLAAVMRALDLVISVDSFPAHLAGALGVPVWTLLQREPDWRWMLHRADSPWYPTMRLYRQTDYGDWTSVIARVADDLGHLR